MPPLFSIVVPSLNQGQFLEQALVSLFNQGGNDFEVIVVDGGSTDGSCEILRRYTKEIEKKEERGKSKEELRESTNENVDACLGQSIRQFSWTSEPDSGQSHALNKGFARARGDYFAWLNADDLLLPGTLEAVRSAIKRDRPLWLAGNMMYIDVHNRITSCLRGERWYGFLYRYAPVHVYGPGAFFSRKLFAQVGGFNEALRYCMDVDLWQRFRSAGASIERLNHYFWGFRRHSGSKTKGGELDKVHIHAEEIQAMYACNGLKITWAGLVLQRCWRLLSGCYLLSLWDTLRLRGRLVCCENDKQP